MSKKANAYFGAIPFRAFPDPDLTELDKTILGVIAAHDAMSLLRGGDGCYAGVDRIAALANANPSNVSGSITKLVAARYLRRDPHPRDGRRSTFRVIYNEILDRGAFKGDVSPAGKRFRGGSLPNAGEMSRPIGESVLPELKSVLPEVAAQPLEVLTSSPEYIEDKKDTLNRPSGESALAEEAEPVANVGAILAQLERRWKDDRLPDHEINTWVGWLFRVIAETDRGDPNHERAQRLQDALIQ